MGRRFQAAKIYTSIYLFRTKHFFHKNMKYPSSIELGAGTTSNAIILYFQKYRAESLLDDIYTFSYNEMCNISYMQLFIRQFSVLQDCWNKNGNKIRHGKNQRSISFMKDSLHLNLSVPKSLSSSFSPSCSPYHEGMWHHSNYSAENHECGGT